jgi:cell division protein FtsW
MLYLKNHLVRVLIGIAFLYLASRLDYRQFRWFTPFLMLVLVCLLIAVLFGPEYHGSRRSFLLLGKRFQPSEFAKLAMIFYMAAVFAKGPDSPMLRGKGLIVHFGVVLLCSGLVFIEPDLGSALVIFSVGFVMFYLAGVSWKKLMQMAFGIILLVALGMAVYPYMRIRMMSYINWLTGKESMSYQTMQSIIGLARGGFTGVGYGEGKQKLLFLPEPFSDFILAIYGEELGFIGMLCLFVLIAIILWRGARIALYSPDRYGFLLAGGITSMILINALVNAGVVVNLLPTTGLPFPFISYGGTSLLVQMISVGILLNISKNSTISYGNFTSDRGTRNLRINAASYPVADRNLNITHG